MELQNENSTLKKPDTLGDRSPYDVRKKILNQSELAFYLELKNQLPQGLHICNKMRIADILETKVGPNYYFHRNEILAKHIDFTICDFSFRPILAIELNGKSHLHPARIRRDEDVTRIFNDAGLPLVFVKVGSSFGEAIQKILNSLQRI